MTRPRLLDLFCGAGGAAMGYHQAGFEVVGVDINPQPNYPFEFYQADALEFPTDGFDAIHASPPCQGYTTMSVRHRGNGGAADSWPKLIQPVRQRLHAAGVPYVIENVPGAKREMIAPLTLEGGMFSLGVKRPRLFESNVNFPVAPARRRVENPIGVYGKLDGRRIWTRKDGTEQRAARTLEEARAAMGVDWMEWRELCEAIPPAYTEWIGTQLLRAVSEDVAA